VAAVAAAGLVIQSRAPAMQTYETAFGQPRVVQLADGSKITLNGGSRLAVRLGRRERQVFVADAEAVFDVAKDPGRPFLIQAGDRQIRVVGTEFNVLRHAGEVRVTVRRGVVEVRPAGKPRAAPIARLVKGQALLHREGKRGDVVRTADPDAAMAWTQGQLVFQGESLAQVAGTLSRYVRSPIEVAPEAQSLPVTAVLNVGDEATMLRSLQAFLPVQVERRDDSVRLSLRR
jgi:transmembrane sensor